MKRTQTTLSAITPIILLLLFLFTPAQSQPIPDFQVNENASPDGSEQSEPDIAGDGNGNYVVTWKDKRNGSNFDIYAQIYSSAGTASGPNFKVSQDPGSGSQYRSRVAVDPNLNFVITWIDKRSRDWDIYAQRFSSDGSPLGDNFKVNEDTGTEEQEHPGIFIDGSGNFTIVWADERDGDWDIYGARLVEDEPEE